MVNVSTNKRPTTVHSVVVAHIRTHATSDFAEQIASWSDDQMLRQMFSNYRDGYGLKLTRIGHRLMSANFKFYSFTLDEPLAAAHLLFLDSRAKMPYYCDNSEIAIYDPSFAVRLRLVDSSVATLMEIDTVD